MGVRQHTFHSSISVYLTFFSMLITFQLQNDIYSCSFTKHLGTGKNCEQEWTEKLTKNEDLKQGETCLYYKSTHKKAAA